MSYAGYVHNPGDSGMSGLTCFLSIALLEKQGPAGKAWCGNGFVVPERAAFSKSVPDWVFPKLLAGHGKTGI
jgi:hypothetical protein